MRHTDPNENTGFDAAGWGTKIRMCLQRVIHIYKM